MGTLLSSPCQLRLGVGLSYLSYILTLELDFISRALFVLDLAHLNFYNFSTLDWWSAQLLVTFIYSWALGLRGLDSQLGTIGKSTVPSSGIVSEI